MTRKFESDYRLRESDDVLVKMRAVLQDLDLRIDAVEIIAKAFKEGNRLDVDALVKSINSDFAQKSAAFQEVLDEIANGLTPDRILETSEKRFTSDEEIGNLQTADNDLSSALTLGLSTKLNSSTFVSHRDNTENPHEVTKAQVGLGDVENIAPADMPLSTAQAAALADKLGGTVRNTVLHGDNANGAPSFLTTGSGLTPAFTATNPLVMTFADGFNANGAKDVLARLTAGASLVAIAASCISYVAATYVDGSNVTWSATKAPPQYGATYNKAAQACLRLASNALDDFGNAWTNNGVTFDGTAGTFNGSTSYLVSTALTTLYPPNSNGGFTIRAKVKPSSLASEKFIASLQASGGYGAFTLSVNTSGKVTLRAGSTGIAWNIADTAVGSATLSIGTEYLVELTYDPTAAKYYIYVNGVLDQTVNSSTKLYAANAYMLVGCSNNTGTVPAGVWSGTIRGFEFLPYCDHPAGTTYSVPASPPDVTTAGYASDWWDPINEKTWVVSGASTVSGSNPMFTSVRRVYPGEFTANATTVTSATAYAFNQTGKNGAGLLNAFGYGQTWQDVSASRSVGTVYSNPYSVPISVNLYIDFTTGGSAIIAYVDDRKIAQTYAAAGYSGGFLSFIVPPKKTYYIGALSNVNTKVWTEFRP